MSNFTQNANMSPLLFGSRSSIPNFPAANKPYHPVRMVVRNRRPISRNNNDWQAHSLRLSAPLFDKRDTNYESDLKKTTYSKEADRSGSLDQLLLCLLRWGVNICNRVSNCPSNGLKHNWNQLPYSFISWCARNHQSVPSNILLICPVSVPIFVSYPNISHCVVYSLCIRSVKAFMAKKIEPLVFNAMFTARTFFQILRGRHLDELELCSTKNEIKIKVHCRERSSPAWYWKKKLFSDSTKKQLWPFLEKTGQSKSILYHVCQLKHVSVTLAT